MTILVKNADVRFLIYARNRVGSGLNWQPADSYSAHFESETGVLRQNNSLFWNVLFENSAD
jgi:hypothetical protein